MTTVVYIGFPLIFLGAIIAGLLVHHAWTHDGKLFTMTDFEKAYTGLFSSHEGIIVLLSLIILGMILGALL